MKPNSITPEQLFYVLTDYNPQWDKIFTALINPITVNDIPFKELVGIVVDRQSTGDSTTSLDLVCLWNINDYNLAASAEEKEKFKVRIASSNMIDIEVQKQAFVAG